MAEKAKEKESRHDVSRLAGPVIPSTDSAQAPTNSRKSDAPAKPKEPKADKFKRLATRRVNAALRVVGYVANLGNRAQYEYTQEQAEQVSKVLQEAVNAVKSSFSGTGKMKQLFHL